MTSILLLPLLSLFSVISVVKKESVRVITVGARSSPLSQAQIHEVFNELRLRGKNINFNPVLVQSQGDIDLTTSLRTLGKTNFFTKEIDDLLLSGQCRIAIHSAKDLPEPIPDGLRLVALTKGLDPSDSLVLRKGEQLDFLRPNAIIATSSERRETAVTQLRKDFTFIDIRGTIHQRLAKLEAGDADGVVIAEAALIRLGLTALNRIRLPGDTVKHQGQLAIMARADDREMREVFARIDSRPTLYLGLAISEQFLPRNILHQPIIKIIPKAPQTAEIASAFSGIPNYTHLVFTSKVGVSIFFEYLSFFGYSTEALTKKHITAVGKATAKRVEQYYVHVNIISREEHAEGIMKELAPCIDENSYVFWPHSSIARPLLQEFFISKKVRYSQPSLYDTIRTQDFSYPDTQEIAEIIFTSPSTVEAFFEVRPEVSQDIWLTSIGPITEAALQQHL